MDRVVLERLLVAVELAELGVWDWHVPSGRVLFSPPGSFSGRELPVFAERRADEWFSVAHPDDIPTSALAVERALRGDAPGFSQYYRRMVGDSWRYVRADARVVEREPGGRAVRIIGTFRDMTGPVVEERGRHARESSARHSLLQATLAEFASGLAHELNQPLAALSGNIQAALRMLAVGGPVGKEARAALERSVHLAERAAEIVRSMRQQVQGEARIDERIDLRALTRDVCDLLRPEAERADVLLVPDAARRPATVSANRGQLEQVLVNLLRNAIEAIGDSDASTRRVSTRVRPGRPMTLVEVEDTGPGVDPEVRSRIFEPYFTTKRAGTGLGLRLCRSIAEGHGGRLVCAPSVRGRGAHFILELPSGAPAASAKRDREGASHPRKRGAPRG